jgi:16S rRNA (uracil1498-N3)-methyltransferase
MHIFYSPDILSEYFTLSEEESKHCIRVLRLKQNDCIHLIDGRGGFYTAKIIDENPKKCKVEITESQKEFKKKNFRLHIAICPTKNIERFEWFVEKATEIGIDEITPMITEHSERKTINTERIRKVIVAACKQSVNAYFPVLNNITKFRDIIKNSDLPTSKFIACYSENHLKDIYIPMTDSLILIGPEGDFSKEEIELANGRGFVNANLGINRLRTETAGIVACHTVNLVNKL